jgi:hypothetical protein
LVESFSAGNRLFSFGFVEVVPAFTCTGLDQEPPKSEEDEAQTRKSWDHATTHWLPVAATRAALLNFES